MSDTVKRKKILSNPGKKYAPSSGSWGGLASAYLDGKPVFTWFDVPRMLRDPQVQFGLRMLRAPFQSAKWKVKAEHPRLAKFVDDSLKKLWQQVTPMLLHHYFSWGYSAASVSFTEKNNRFVVEGCNVFQSTDIKPRVWTEGPKKGEFAAVEVSSIGEPMELVGKPHGIWFAGLQEHGKFFDRPRLAGAFEPWLESNGRNGAKASRRLWSRKCAFDSGMIRHPLGDVNIGTDESPNMVAGMDLAREILDAHESGSGMTLPNTPNQSGAGYAWEWTPPSSRGDAARVLDYPEQLDKEILRGLGIPPEVIEASEVGSGWSGRSIPMMAYLGSADEIVASLIHAIVEFVIRPAAVINFGKRGSDFEVDAIPLAKILMPDQVEPQGKDQQQPSSPFGMPQPQPGQPVQLSFVAEQTRVGTTKAVGQDNDSGRVLYGKEAKAALAADDTVSLERAPEKDQLGAIGRVKHRLGQKREELTKRIEALPGGNAILATGRIGLKIFHAVEKPLMFAQHKSQAIAVQVAKERGFTEEQTTTLARALTVADFAGGYVTGGVALTLAGPMAAKVASFLPSASLAYVAYSAAKDPVATYKAAKKVIAETFGRSSEELSMIDNPAFAKRLTDTIADLPSDQADWFVALFSAAIEHTEGDVEKAYKLAVAGLKKSQSVQLSHVQQPGIKPDDLSALTLALIDAAMEDDDQSLERLTDLLNDPDALAEALGGDSANLSWVEYGQSRTGKSRWKDTATGQVRYQKSKPGSRVERKATANATLATEAIASIKSGQATTEDLAKFANNIDSLTKPQLKQLRQELGAKFAVNATYRDNMVKQLRRYVMDADNFKGVNDEPAGPEPGRGETASQDAIAGGRVEEKTRGPDPAAADTSGDSDGQRNDLRPARKVPAEISTVNRKLDRYTKIFRDNGQWQAADWMNKLRSHVNSAGVEEALASLGEDRGDGKGKSAEYEGAWLNEDATGLEMGDFFANYLNRHGITFTSYDASGEAPLISSVAPSYGGSTQAQTDKDNLLRDPTLANKLEEAKKLPGLEKSEDIDKVIGEKVTHLTPEIMGKLDQEYGEGRWIVKAYGDDAAAGYGIFFPQRSRQIIRDAQNTIWNAGSEIARYGFKIARSEKGEPIGIEHQGGDRYLFGSKKYESTIDGDVRLWADRAAAAAANEKGAQLPGDGKEFMVQPAFKAVGVSDADRAAGKTIAPGEGRTHIITRNGKAELIPNSTWIKGEHLPVVFESDETRAMAQAAVDAINALPESERQGQIYAPDIIKAEDGYRVVEANPANNTGSSGYLGNNPMIIDAYVSSVLGREPAHVAFIRKLLSKKDRGEGK